MRSRGGNLRRPSVVKKLDVPFRTQQGDWLCWAACMEMVAAYKVKSGHALPSAVNQCTLAQEFNAPAGIPDCCTTLPKCLDCNQGCRPDEIEDRYRRIGVGAVTRNNSPSAIDLRRALAAGELLQVGWNFFRYRHVVLAIGYQSHADGAEWVWVHDPSTNRGDKKMRLAQFFAQSLPNGLPERRLDDMWFGF